MVRESLKYFLIILGIIFIDQYIKHLFVDGFRYDGSCISGVLVYNKGVAFSLFSFLDENLKWIQIVILGGVLFYIFKYAEKSYYFPTAIIVGAGISNIADRFNYEGVVDYLYWHCGFDFAIFNFADVMIDFGVVWILYLTYKEGKKERNL